jgi:UDP-N-acetylglucosamine--N-acetylmuramyl-(pentapeptide) pyrophosphoryl-undecaprenol N-acetylglucosamine transferase
VRSLRLAVATGPTLGHLHPALAFVEAYRRFAAVDPIVFGPDDEAARALVAAARAPFVATPTRAWQGVSPLAKLGAVFQALRAVPWARRLLARHGAEVVVGFGGHVSGPVVLAGRSLGAAVAIHEANVEPGMANRWLAPFVDRVFVSQPRASWPSRRGRSTLTGIPLRPGFAALASGPKDAPAAGEPFRLLVSSGSRGAAFLARKVPGLLGQLRAKGVAVEIRQQAEASELGPLREAYARLGVPAQVEAYLEDMPGACAWAHLAICRAGAGTLAELAAAGLPAIVVPLAAASEDHQSANAAAFTSAGAGLLVGESAWSTDAIAAQVERWAGDVAAWRVASQAARSLAQLDASDLMVAGCEELRARPGR